MKRVSIILRLVLISAVTMLIINACTNFDDFTTYFNTYYNADKLIKISEEEFEYQTELKRTTPRVVIPDVNIKTTAQNLSGVPPFMNEFIIDQKKLQPVKIKLDSVIIKGSKILARHPNSQYIEKTLYLMAVAYFYRNEWLPSQIKCNELVDRFFDGDLSPDAHLLLSKTYFIQRKFPSGNIMLSRTIDIAWQKERYDILSEAFRLQAEMALYNNDIEKAVRPYKQAIAQTSNSEIKAKWQLELATIYYRKSKFEQSYAEYYKALSYSPDYQGEFESYLYQALSLMRMQKYDAANEILSKLESKSIFEEWKAYIHNARMDMARLKTDDKEYTKLEKYADSAFINHPSGLAVYFQKGLDYYNKNDYTSARKYFAKTRVMKSPVYNQSERMFYYLNTWETKRNDAKPYLERFYTGNLTNDTNKRFLATSLFDVGRVHEQLDHPDSALVYYNLCNQVSPVNDTLTARYLYALSRMTTESNLKYSDSLLEVIIERFPRTEYGKEAMKKMGYTDKFLIDSIADLYFSGNSLRNNREYSFAIKQYTNVYTKYPESKFAPKSLYAIGLIYERNLNNKDSALIFYDMLIQKYPRSEQAKELKLPVAYLNLIKKGEAIPDSLKDKPLSTFRPTIDPYAETVKLKARLTEWEAEKKKRDQEFNMENFLKNPSLLKAKAKEIIKDPGKAMPGMELPDFKALKNKMNVDSLKKEMKLDSLNINSFIQPLAPDSTKKKK